MNETRDTPVTYSREEAARVREIVGTDDQTLICPRCGDELKVGFPVAAGGTVQPVWEVRCQGCHRSAYVLQVGRRHRPSPDERPT